MRARVRSVQSSAAVKGEALFNLSTGGIRAIELDPSQDRRWLDFVSSHPDALIYHHPGWLRALASEYGGECLALGCEDAAGKLQGVLPLLYTRGMPLQVARNQTGRRLSSLPRTPLAGPLTTSSQATVALVRAAIDRVRLEPGVQLELKTTIPDLDKMVDGLGCMRWRDTYVRGLPENDSPRLPVTPPGGPVLLPGGDCEAGWELRFGNARNHHHVKWAINKALKQGLRIRPAESENELRAWYRLYLRVTRRNVVPPRPYRFFDFLWNELRPHGQMSLLLVEQHDAGPGNPRIVGGSILLRFSQTVFWAFTGADEKDFSLHPNDLTLWCGLHDSYRCGYGWFDLGEVAEDHPELARFKEKWGALKKPMYRYYFPASTAAGNHNSPAPPTLTGRAGRALWQKLPLSLTATLGDWIYGYL